MLALEGKALGCPGWTHRVPEKGAQLPWIELTHVQTHTYTHVRRTDMLTRTCMHMCYAGSSFGSS